MILNDFTQQEREDLTVAFYTLIKRLNGKIRNDSSHGKEEYNRIHYRKEKIERCQQLLKKVAIHVEEEVCIGA